MTRTADLPALDRPVGTHLPVLRVLIADDHAFFRRALRVAIDRRPGLALVGEAADGEEALRLIDELQPDVAVLDHRMPGLTGAQVCAALRDRGIGSPPTALLVVSAFEDGELVRGAVERGAVGYLGKTATHAEICAAIEEVGRGGVAFTATTRQGLAAT